MSLVGEATVANTHTQTDRHATGINGHTSAPAHSTYRTEQETKTGWGIMTLIFLLFTELTVERPGAKVLSIQQ